MKRPVREAITIAVLCALGGDAVHGFQPGGLCLTTNRQRAAIRRSGPSPVMLGDLLRGRPRQVQFGELKVSEMGIGTWSWGNQLLWGYEESMDPEIQAVFDLCVDRGITLFDTGDSYGTGKLNGQAEKLLGKFMKDYAARNGGKRPYIGTKFATYPWRLTAESLVAACQESAERLQRPVDVGQIHWPAASYAPWQERALWDGLAKMYNEGYVSAVGLSNYGPKQLRKVHSYLSAKGVPIAANQIQYSLLSRKVGDEVKEVCDELGICMIAYSPLGLGILGGRYMPGSSQPAPPGFRGLILKQRIQEAAPLLSVLADVAEQRGKTVAQVSINWCICKGTVPIPGARTLQQAHENLGAMGWRLSQAEVQALDAAADLVPRELVQVHRVVRFRAETASVCENPKGSHCKRCVCSSSDANFSDPQYPTNSAPRGPTECLPNALDFNALALHGDYVGRDVDMDQSSCLKTESSPSSLHALPHPCHALPRVHHPGLLPVPHPYRLPCRLCPHDHHHVLPCRHDRPCHPFWTSGGL